MASKIRRDLVRAGVIFLVMLLLTYSYSYLLYSLRKTQENILNIEANYGAKISKLQAKVNEIEKINEITFLRAWANNLETYNQLVEKKVLELKNLPLELNHSATRVSQAKQEEVFFDGYLAKKIQPELVKTGNVGVFVEFGARNGVYDSNSHFLEKSLGWRGIIAEALKAEQLDIVTNRPGSAIINGAICEKPAIMEFVTGNGGWGGLKDSYDQMRRGIMEEETIKVPCYTLTYLLNLFNIRHVNYMSVDTEGSEINALRSFPWDRVRVDIFNVEVLLGTPEREKNRKDIIQYMKSLNYQIFKDFIFGDDTADIFFVPKEEMKSQQPKFDYEAFVKGLFKCQDMKICL